RQGSQNAELQLKGLRERYGLDDPIYVQYWLWVSHFAVGDFGESFAYNRPVSELIGDSLLLTVIISVVTLLLSWVIAIPIGVYSATHQYSTGDQFFTFISFIGLATPGFLLALILMVISVYVFKFPISGLFSPGMETMPWSFAKVVDLFKHLWVPVLLIGMSGTAELVRIMRGNLLDVLNQQYVLSARGRGLAERVVIWKHAVRMAINPLISLIGLQFPSIISGSIIISIVLSLPTTGPLLYRALRTQDMYLAGSFLMLLSLFLIIGNFLADIALAWVDPRITYE
ncbi:MAG TPA: ABC transporter permease, partial [Caldilineaceae bacterium]|nr:ABC transporter permease [Caldilineaceae bacterium]